MGQNAHLYGKNTSQSQIFVLNLKKNPDAKSYLGDMTSNNEVMDLGELMKALPSSGLLEDEDEAFLEQIVPRTPNISTGTGYDSDELNFLKKLETEKPRRLSVAEQIVKRNMRSRARMMSMERRGSVQPVPLPPSLQDSRTFAKKDSVLNFLQGTISSHFLFTELETRSIFHMAKSM